MKQGWEYKRLGEVCKITMGQSPNGNSINNNNEGIEFHQGKTCFGERTLGISTLFSSEPTKLAEAHSVLLCVRAPVGFPNITDRQICIGRGLCALYAKEGINNTFLFYSLLGKQSYFEKNATGSTFKAISSKVVSDTIIPLPPKSTQLAIVSELDKINELIRLKKEQLKDYDNLAQSLFYQMFGDPVENEMGWEVKKLGDNVKEMFLGPFGSALKVDSYVPKDDSYCMVYEQKHAIKKSINLENHYINKEKFDSLQRFSVMPGDFIMSCRGTIGKLYQIPKGAPLGIIHPSLMKIRLKENGYNSTYFQFMLIKIVANESTNGNCVQMAITAKALGKKELPLPPLPLQQLFAQRIEQIERQKAEVQKAIADLETLLASRMQYWFE